MPADPIIAIPDDLPNQSRALHLSEYAGLILLKDGTMSNTNDILQNKQGITFLKADSEDMPKVLSRVYAAVMNTATAINADMNPKRDTVVLEPINDAYSNVLVVRASDANKPPIKALLRAFNSSKVRKYIDDKLYSYGIVSAF
ncbi:hypothetical protein FACS1894216_22060 [Synergistales bacterium]|nr:hypothetical protein FACS1894216_22060 [Synergistales bacterium]